MKKKLQSFSPGGRTVAAVVETLSSSRGVHLIVDEDDDDDDDENTDDEDDKNDDDDDECNFQVEVEGLLNRHRDNINNNNNKVAGNESAMTTYPLMQALAVANYRSNDGSIGRDHRKSHQQQQQQQQSVLVPHRGVTCPIIPSRPELIRPIALKVIRPIPREAVEQFYQQAYEEGITGDFVHAAVIESHEWHRRWTQQEETGHTMPHDQYDEKNDERRLILQPVQQPSSLDKHMSDNSNSNSTNNQNRVPMMGSLPDHYAFHALDRATGAKNPSPEEKDQFVYEQRKRTLDVQGGGGGVDDEHPKHASSDRCCKGSVLSLSPGSDDGDESVPDVRPFFKRRHRIDQGAHHGHDNEKKIPIQQPPPVGIVRPVAIRIARPVAVRPPPPPPSESVLRAGDDGDGTDGPVPRDIMRALQQTPSSLSPLTMPSMSSSQRQTQEQRSQVNVFEMDDDDDHDACFRRQRVPHVITHPGPEGLVQNSVSMARDGILHALAVSGGDAKSENFDQCLQVLVDHFQSLHVNTSSNENYATEGLWLTLTKPTFFGCAGENDNGDPLYTLGRMSFDMFSPTSIVCSLQGNFNTVERVRDDDRLAIMNTVPKSLREEVEQGKTVLRTYNIVTAFTIEPSLAMYPNAPNRDVHRPIRGIMTTYGYTLADPEKPNRHSVWITGGKIEPNDDDHDQREWKILFGRYPPKHGFGEQAKLLAVKLLMGARIPKHMNVDDGSMEYAFTRPLGGHGLAYVDTLYVDETLRIVRGHRGTIFVFNRLPDKSHASSSTW